MIHMTRIEQMTHSNATDAYDKVLTDAWPNKVLICGIPTDALTLLKEFHPTSYEIGFNGWLEFRGIELVEG